MKLLHYLTGVLLIGFGSSCSTYTPGISAEPDDRYYSLRDAKKEQREARKLSEAQNSAFTNAGSIEDQALQNNSYQRITDPSDFSPNDGSTVINNYYNDPFDMDDYYDFMYSSRIRRFHRNNVGFGYYDPFFTNMYFYNPNPLLFGTSIYSTYGFFNPYVPWGFNNWNRPGWNFGWNSFTGFYLNFNSGWGNPWNAFNNPWRWNNWGYDPWMSPFSYNPWGFNPWGFYGGNAFNNGYMLGYSNALMYNNMMNNPLYYNSFDNNTFNYNNTVVNNTYNYGSNTPGAAGGSSFKQTGMTSLFTKEIGQSVSATHAGNDVKFNQAQKPGDVKNPTTISPATSTTGGKNPVSVKPSVADPVKGQAGTQVQAAGDKGNTQQSVKPSIAGAGKPEQSTQPSANPAVQPVKGAVTDSKNPGAPVIQSGKDNLIQQGKPVTSNYSSTPVKGSVAAPENSPASLRPDIVNPSNNVRGDVSGRPTSPAVQSSGSVQTPKTYMPNYDYNTGVRSPQTRPSNDIRNYTPAVRTDVTPGTSTQPGRVSTPARENNLQPAIQRYDMPKQSAPVQNNQQMQTPGRDNTQQPGVTPGNRGNQNQQIQTPVPNRSNEQPRQMAPQQNYQRYEAPRQSAPQQNYQRYEAPRQSAPQQNYQRYEAPRQNTPSRNLQRNDAPRQSAPSQRFDTPSRSNQRFEAPKPSRDSYRAPAPARNSYQTPSRINSSPRSSDSFSAPSRSSAPSRINSSPRSSGSFSAPSRSSAPKSTSPSSGSRSGGSRSISSPRR